MRKQYFITLLICLLAPMVWAGEKEEAAEKAATAWLQKLDQKNYAETWQETALLLRNQVPVNQWVKSLSELHQMFGRKQSRFLKAAHYTTNLPGAPDGEYVVLQYNTIFENKKGAIETVTPMLENGEWRISGYYIK